MTETAIIPICPRCGEPNGLERTAGMRPEFAALASRCLCDDCERVVDKIERDELAIERERVHRIRVNDTLPAALRSVYFKDSRTPDYAKDAVRDWVKTGGGLFLFGSVGTGKTYLAAAGTRVALGNHPVTWTAVPSLIIRATAAFDDEERHRAIAAIAGTGALVLDDIDKVKPSPWVASQLFSAIDSRVTAGTRLLITSNLSPGQLGKRIGGEIGQSITSRIVGYCDAVCIEGTDLRSLKGGKA